MVVSQKAQKDGRPDFVLLALASTLIIWGIVAVGTISFPFSLERYGNPWYYLLHQILMLIIGVVFGFIFFKLSLKKLKKAAPFLFLLNLLLVAFVFLPKIGVEIGGARRWLSFGGFTFQPSEFLKITFVLYLSAWLSERFNKIPRKESGRTSTTFVPFLIILIVLGAILLSQPDMSTLGIIAIVGILMYFIAPTVWWHGILMLFGGGGAALALIKLAPYRARRLIVFLNPETDPMGMGYQLRQSLIAIGSGKIFGIEGGFGFGLSRQKFGFLPQPMTDSIFAIIGEELGFIGCALLITLFLFLAWRGLKIALSGSRTFNKLLALGITLWLIVQALFNIAGITGILPLAGIPLPFFSYGGSHLIAEIIGIGLLLNISKNL